MDLHCERPIHTCFCQLCNTAQPSLVHCVKCSNYFCQCSAVCTLYSDEEQCAVKKYALALYKSAAPAEIALECCVHCALPMQWKCVQKSAKQCIMDCILGNTLQLTIIRNVYRKVQSVPTQIPNIPNIGNTNTVHQILETPAHWPSSSATHILVQCTDLHWHVLCCVVQYCTRALIYSGVSCVGVCHITHV